MKRIIFTGGGSGGHVVPAITIIKELQNEDNLKIQYIGSYSGIERKLITELNIKYKPILTGKLRRYFSFQNFIDIFKVALAIVQAFFYLLPRRSNAILLSTGGFVSVPPVIAAWILRIPIYIHEQTSRIGLANKIASKFASKVFISFKDSADYFPKEKTIYSGYPVRMECFTEEITKGEIKGRKLTSITKPILFVTGGGNGSYLLNSFIEDSLPRLKQKFLVIHQVGKKNLHKYSKFEDENYIAVAFVDHMIDMFKLSQIVISRAGAGTVSELIALKKPSIFIPLKIAQKNEQYHNAMEAKRLLQSIVIEEDNLYDVDLLSQIETLENLEINDIQNINNRALEIIINQISSC